MTKYEFRRYPPLPQITAEEAKKKLEYEMAMAFAGVIEVPILKAIVEADSPEEAKEKVKTAEWKDDVMVVRTF